MSSFIINIPDRAFKQLFDILFLLKFTIFNDLLSVILSNISIIKFSCNLLSSKFNNYILQSLLTNELPISIHPFPILFFDKLNDVAPLVLFITSDALN